MNDHNHSRYMLNPLPGERPAVQEAIQQAVTTGAATVTLPPLSEDSSRLVVTAAPTPGQMFCQFCAQPVVTDAVLCVHCGRQIKTLQGAAEKSPEPKRISWHIGEMILLIFLIMICPLIGYIYGYIGSKEPGKERQAKVLMVVAAVFNILYVYAYLSAQTPSHP